MRLVLPFAAGSAVDVLGRHYAQKMSEQWKQQVVVDNRTGANGIIGTEFIARGAKRAGATPEIPSIAESGVPGYDFDSWTGVLLPAGTAAEIVNRVNTEVLRVTRLPETKDRLSGLGFALIGSTPAEFSDYIRANIGRIGKVVQAAGIKPE